MRKVSAIHKSAVLRTAFYLTINRFAAEAKINETAVYLLTDRYSDKEFPNRFKVFCVKVN